MLKKHIKGAAILALLLLLLAGGCQKQAVEPQNSAQTPEKQISANFEPEEQASEQDQDSLEPQTELQINSTEPDTQQATANSPTKTTGEQSSNNASNQEKAVKDNLVMLTIIGPDEVGQIFAGEYELAEEETTVLDVLIAVTAEQEILLDYSGFGSSCYIMGIDNIYEFDYGAKSGWMYMVNDTIPSKSAAAYTVQKGDEISWQYTKNLGKDLQQTESSGTK